MRVNLPASEFHATAVLAVTTEKNTSSATNPIAIDIHLSFGRGYRRGLTSGGKTGTLTGGTGWGRVVISPLRWGIGRNCGGLRMSLSMGIFSKLTHYPNSGGTQTSTVTLGEFGPSFSLLDGKHVAGIIVRSDGSGAYGGGTYDIIGPTGTSLGYPTVAAKAGDTIELFGVGFGPTNPSVSAEQLYSGAAATTNPVHLSIGGSTVLPSFAGLSSAGLYQINVTVPQGLGTGDLALVGTVGGVQTQPKVLISLQ